ncbi:MAG: formimidoylglutamate deiminase, partial [Alphaproteobacteria bacterium]|nr:formimidoylglutamate deiminase [Alphaproteobacteria bacterium]
MTDLFCDTAMLGAGWATGVRIAIDATGSITAINANADPRGAERVAGAVIPGMPNLHSHAFQRAMAGLAERAGPGGDSFWTWREVMYGFVRRLGPEQVEAIAAQLYVEMAKAGYTAVAEFHYLHHQPDGSAYADPAELSLRVIEAARRAGIGITHLPVLYRHGGFGAKPAAEGQRRFLNDADRFLGIVERLRLVYADIHDVRIGMAPHSLRATSPELLADAIAGLERMDRSAPIHIHIAEQAKEVDECVAWSGARPVAWLLDHMPVGARWCLVHATHMVDAEVVNLARTGAVAGLCPTTEANLGDGLFALPAYLAAHGSLGIGSDSHISVSPIEELRWLEYGQRLARRERNVATTVASPHVGAELYRLALAGGAQAVARPVGSLAPGQRADLVVLDPDHPSLAGRSGDTLLDAFVFAGNTSPVRHVMAGGRWIVRDGRHAHEDAVADAYRRTV